MRHHCPGSASRKADSVDYRYEYNPGPTEIQVGDLREAVGCDARVEKYQIILGNTYLRAACFHGDELVGYVDVVSDGIHDAYMRDLMVDPKHDRHGIASNLIAMITERVKGSGIKMFSVLFEPHLAEFYSAAGFHVMGSGEIYFES